MVTYKLVNGLDGKPMCVNRSDGWSIPIDPENYDYRRYLEWLAAGNEPLPADAPQQETGA